MSDLGDMVRLYERLGIEHEIEGAWSQQPDLPAYFKILTVEDPEVEHYPGGNKHHGIEFRFTYDGKYLGMTMWYEMRDREIPTANVEE